MFDTELLFNMSTTVVKRHKKKPALRLMERIEECEKTGQYKLDITHLELTELPLEINVVVRISQLLAYGNKLYSIPPLSNFRNLTILDLSRNKLTTLDTIRIVHLQNLTLLDVSRNMLDALPGDICRLPVLVTLICHRNKLVCIYVYIFIFISPLSLIYSPSLYIYSLIYLMILPI